MRHLVTRRLYGVDRHPVAVRICELRLWLEVLRAMRGRPPGRIPPLARISTPASAPVMRSSTRSLAIRCAVATARSPATESSGDSRRARGGEAGRDRRRSSCRAEGCAGIVAQSGGCRRTRHRRAAGGSAGTDIIRRSSRMSVAARRDLAARRRHRMQLRVDPAAARTRRDWRFRSQSLPRSRQSSRGAADSISSSATRRGYARNGCRPRPGAPSPTVTAGGAAAAVPGGGTCPISP